MDPLEEDRFTRHLSFGDRIRRRLSSAIPAPLARADSDLSPSKLLALSSRLSEREDAADPTSQLTLERFRAFPVVLLEGPNQLHLRPDPDDEACPSFSLRPRPNGWKANAELWRFYWVNEELSRSLQPYRRPNGRLCILLSLHTHRFLTQSPSRELMMMHPPFSPEIRQNLPPYPAFFESSAFSKRGLCLFDPSCFRKDIAAQAEVVLIFSLEQLPVGRDFLTIDLTPVLRVDHASVRIGAQIVHIAHSQGGAAPRSPPAAAGPLTQRKQKADSGLFMLPLHLGLPEIFSVELRQGMFSLRHALSNAFVGLAENWPQLLTSGDQTASFLKSTGPVFSPEINTMVPGIKISLRANTMRFVCAHPLGNKLICNRKKAATWEYFLVQYDSPSASITLRTSLDRYWSVHPSSGKVSAAEKLLSARTQFRLDWKSSDRLAIIASNGNYIRVKGNELVADRPNALEPSAIFQVGFLGDAYLLSSEEMVFSTRNALSSRASDDGSRNLLSPSRYSQASEEDEPSDTTKRISKTRLRMTIRAELSQITEFFKFGITPNPDPTSASPMNDPALNGSSAISRASPTPPLPFSPTPSSSTSISMLSPSPSPGLSPPSTFTLPELSTTTVQLPPPYFGKERVLYQLVDIITFHRTLMSLGTIFITDYRVAFAPSAISRSTTKSRTWTMPLSCIDRIVKTGKAKEDDFIFGFELHLYNLRSIRLCTTPNTFQWITMDKLHEALQECMKPHQPEASYALSAGIQLTFPSVDVSSFLANDYRRLGFPNALVRLSETNANFNLCKSYPQLLAVPSSITDEDLQAIAEFRSKGRVPSIVWINPKVNAMLVRCSQPRTGLRNARCEADESFLFHVRTSSHNPGVIQLLDARPLLNAMANRFKGAGTENLSSGYPNCTRKFLNIGNIHKMRHCLERLRVLLSESPNNQHAVDTGGEMAGNGYEELWIEHIRLIVSGAHFAADALLNGISCVVHCSDGWDRTPQITALTQVILDPFYRTVVGFQILIEKEWCAFGHKFCARMASTTKKLNDSERAPIFLQWVDSVWQLMTLFPKAFEFNQAYLKEILHHCHSGRFGTFLFDTFRQRQIYQLAAKTDSLWTALVQTHTEDHSAFTNPRYELTYEPLLAFDPNKPESITFWADLFLDEEYPFASTYST